MRSEVESCGGGVISVTNAVVVSAGTRDMPTACTAYFPLRSVVYASEQATGDNGRYTDMTLIHIDRAGELIALRCDGLIAGKIMRLRALYV